MLKNIKLIDNQAKYKNIDGNTKKIKKTLENAKNIQKH